MKSLHSAGFMGLILATMSGPALAAGFAIAEQSGSGLGNAYAGGAAAAEDAATVWYNPAGMTRHANTNMTAALHVILPDAEFTNSATTPSLLGGAVPIAGANSETDRLAGVPNLYATHQLNDRVWLGLGLNAPYGLVTEYEGGWVGRYHALKSEIKTINVNPSVAYKLSESLSIGAGLSWQRIEAELSNSVDFAALDFGTGVTSIYGASGGLGLAGTLGTAANDGFAKLDADDSGSLGWNLGLMFEPRLGTRVGVAYRSKVEHDLEGTATFDVPTPAVTASLLGTVFVTSGVTAELELPQTVSASAYHEYSDRFAIMADASWTDWSAINIISVNFANAAQGAALASLQTSGSTAQQLALDFEDTWRLAIGANYQYTEDLKLRAGVAWDESPVKSATTRTARLPDEDRLWLSVGVSFDWSERTTLDFGYTHLFVDDVPINNATATGTHVLTGEYDSTVDIFSAQLNMEF